MNTKRPCSVQKTSRSVIEHKLLTALEDGNTVAALFSKQDLEDMIAALYGYELGERKGNVLSWEAHMKRRKELADSMSQLLSEAFPKSGRDFGYVCPTCGEQINDSQETEHTDAGLAHAQCTPSNQPPK